MDVPLDAGTFWLTLLNATDASNVVINSDYWDRNNGPSLAEEFFDGSSGTIPSESFQIDGVVTPEPVTLALSAIGFLILAGIGRVGTGKLG